MKRQLTVAVLFALALFQFNTFAQNISYDSGTSITLTNDVTTQDSIYVGQYTSDNDLIVKATVRDFYTVIGSSEGANNNSLHLMNTNSIFRTSNSLIIGQNGAGNNLTISNGGFSENQQTIIGTSLSASNNYALVTGVGSTLLNSGLLLIGEQASSNSLTIADGGHASSDKLIIGDGKTSNNNILHITGNNSSLTNNTSCIVGYNGSKNHLLISEGGRFYSNELIIGNSGFSNGLTIAKGGYVKSSKGTIGIENITTDSYALVSGLNSTWEIANTLTLGADDSSSNSLIIANGGHIKTGQLSVSQNLSSGANNIQITGPGSTLTSSDIRIGTHAHSGCNLTIADDGRIESDTTIIQSGSQTPNNILITGSNSRWNNTGAFEFDSFGSLAVSNYAKVNIGGALKIDRGTLYIGSTSTVTSKSYLQRKDATLEFGLSRNAANSIEVGQLIAEDIATIVAGSALLFSGEISNLDFAQTYSNKLINVTNESGDLIIETTNDSLALSVENTLMKTELFVLDNDLWATFIRKELAEAAGFDKTDSSSTARILAELDTRADEKAVQNILNFIDQQGYSQSELKATLKQQYDRGTANYMHGKLLVGAGDQVKAKGHSFQVARRSAANQPSGVAGPHEENQNMRTWVKGYGSWGNYDAGGSSAYDLDVFGSVIGIDKAYGNVLLGVAGGYGKSTIDESEGDSSEATTSYGVAYASFGSEAWFGDVNIGYGTSDIESRSASLGGASNFDANTLTFYMGGGKAIECADGKYLITPEAGLLTSMYSQDGYLDNIAAMQVDDYDRTGLQSRIGTAFSLEKPLGSVILKPELRAFWLHEFNTDADKIGYSLIGGSDRYNLAIQSPVADLFELGAGLSAKVAYNFEISFDIDGVFSSEYNAYTLSGKLKYEY